MQWNVRVDSKKAQAELGFAPMSLSDGVALTVAYLRREGLVP
jgi:nucleoside-diphosphate-sugar epimerase